MTIVVFLLILTALIFVHELGHFSVAKFFKVRVDEFAIGFPPKVWSMKKGETTYSINLIPFGGYVKIFGENPDEESQSGADSARSLANTSRWKQILILLAGVFMNFVFAWLLISASYMIGMAAVADEYPNVTNTHLTITGVLPNSPASMAGLKVGDEITDITLSGTHIQSPAIDQVQSLIAKSTSTIDIAYLRGTATGTIALVSKEGIIEGKKAVGISMDMVGIVRFGFFRSLYEGAKLTGSETLDIAKGIYHFIIGAFSGAHSVFEQVAGPVGIVGLVGDAEHLGFSYLLGFIAMISINLAVLNLIPFPALDGGRIFFILIEAASRKKIKPAVLNWINLAGFALIIGLMVFITYQDIARLIH
jgi:regulator of sigma E protease